MLNLKAIVLHYKTYQRQTLFVHFWEFQLLKIGYNIATFRLTMVLQFEKQSIFPEIAMKRANTRHILVAE